MNDKFDVEFLITAGDHEGEVYGFMLATKENGAEEWTDIRTRTKPPYMEANEITMVIAAVNDQLTGSGIAQNKNTTRILRELEIVSASTDSYDHAAILTKSGGIKYHVMIDKDSPVAQSLPRRGEEEPEYQILLKAWGIYTNEE